jgi:hypothetical protein
VGCAAAMIYAALTGKNEPTCGPDPEPTCSPSSEPDAASCCDTNTTCCG